MTDLIKIKAIYTDGSCLGNPGGAGGYAYRILFADGEIHEGGGHDPSTTNNRMELMAAIAALSFIAEYPIDHSFTVISDSDYVVKGITAWVKEWRRNGWKTRAGKPVLNENLWRELYMLNYESTSWKWVKGHSGHLENERCDKLAKAFALGQSPDLILHPELSSLISVRKK